MPQLLDGEQEAQLIALRLGPPPPGFGNWSLRLMARQVVELGIVGSISYETARARELVRRIEFRHTPKHGSWLNIAECELSAMTRQCLNGRRIGDLDELWTQIAAWSTDINTRQRGVEWRMKIDDARYKLKSVYPKVIV